MAAVLINAAPVLLVIGVCLLFNMPDSAKPGRWWDA